MKEFEGQSKMCIRDRFVPASTHQDICHLPESYFLQFAKMIGIGDVMDGIVTFFVIFTFNFLSHLVGSMIPSTMHVYISAFCSKIYTVLQKTRLSEYGLTRLTAALRADVASRILGTSVNPK